LKQPRSTRHVERDNWWRGPTRRVGKFIVATDPDLWEQYELYREPDVALQLASVKDAAGAVDFSKRFGFLHVRAENGVGRESDEIVHEAAKQLGGILRLHIALQKAAAGEAEDLRKKLPTIRKVLSREPGHFLPPLLGDHPSDARLIGHAAIALSWLVNDGLAQGDVQRRIAAANTLGRSHFDPDEFAEVSRSRDLLGFAYSQLAELIVPRTPVRSCEGCQRFFEVTDPRKRFHDAACRARHQMRELRQRAREAKRR
jgi:hypothetical protein